MTGKLFGEVLTPINPTEPRGRLGNGIVHNGLYRWKIPSGKEKGVSSCPGHPGKHALRPRVALWEQKKRERPYSAGTAPAAESMSQPEELNMYMHEA